MSWKLAFDNQVFRPDSHSAGYTGDGFVLGDLFYVLQNQGIRGGDQVAGTLAFGKFVATGLYQAICDVGLIPFALNEIGEAHLPIFTRLLKAMASVTAGLKALTPNEKVLHTKDIGKHTDLMEPMFRIVADMCRCPKSDRSVSEFASAVYMPSEEAGTVLATGAGGWPQVDAQFKSLVHDKRPVYSWGAWVYVALNHITDRKEWKKQWDARWAMVTGAIEKRVSAEAVVHIKSMITLVQQSYKGKDTFSYSPSRRGAWMLAMTILSDVEKCSITDLPALDEKCEFVVLDSMVATLNTEKKAFSDRTLKVEHDSVCHFGTARGNGADMMSKLIKAHGGMKEFKTLTEDDKRMSSAPLKEFKKATSETERAAELAVGLIWDRAHTPCLPTYLALTNRAYESGASADLFDTLSDMYRSMACIKSSPEEISERFADKQWLSAQHASFSNQYGFDPAYFSAERPKKVPVPSKKPIEVSDDEIDVAARADGPAPKKRKKAVSAPASVSDTKDVKSSAKSDGVARSSSAAAAATGAAVAAVAPKSPYTPATTKHIPPKDSKKRKNEVVYNFEELTRWKDLKCMTAEETWQLNQRPLLIAPSESNRYKGTYVSKCGIMHGPFNCLDPQDSLELRSIYAAHPTQPELVPADRCESTFAGMIKESAQPHRIWVLHNASIGPDRSDWSMVQSQPTPKNPVFYNVVSPASLQLYNLESCTPEERYLLVRGMLLASISSLVHPRLRTEVSDFYISGGRVYRMRYHSARPADEVEKRAKENLNRSVLYTLFDPEPTAAESFAIAAEMKSHAVELRKDLDTLRTTIAKWLSDRSQPPISAQVELVFVALLSFL